MLHDTVTRADLAACLSYLRKTPCAGETHLVFVDLTDLTDACLTFLDLLGFAERLRSARSGPETEAVAQPLRIAMHAPGQLAFGVARMCQQLLESISGIEITVVSVMEQGLLYLAIDALPETG